MEEKVAGRFAPSPSGRLHLGNLFCSLLAWLSAKSRGGRVVLRIEDLDPARTSRAFADQLERDLEFLGLFWDEGGSGGGTIVATGTPEEVAACPASYTGQYLKKMLG